MTTYAIGDLQGCCGQLQALLDKIHAATPEPQLVFVGDLVNRGPQSLATLRLVRSMGDSARTVLGNHDLHLLAAAQGIRKPHRSDTIEDILNAPDRDELLDWIRHQPLALSVNDYLIVHAGVMPQWTPQQALSLAAEVEAVLRGPDWRDFLRQMYGNTPARWDDGLQGMDRLRCIVNAMTRMRFCKPDGEMDFSKEGPEATPPGTMPWFDVPDRRTATTTIIFGHWSTLGLLLRPDVIALDTGCIWGGKLTALRLDDRSILQVDCPQHQVPGPR
jgi:bis(5'-nucleosyl)-tetraphosphatase (symmetrical)